MYIYICIYIMTDIQYNRNKIVMITGISPANNDIEVVHNALKLNSMLT